MAKVKITEKGYVHWKCQGCGLHHYVPTKADIEDRGGNHPVWGFNGSTESPSLSPSIRVQCKTGDEQKPLCCHFFIRDGKQDFCGDCTHELKGKMVELKDIDAER